MRYKKLLLVLLLGFISCNPVTGSKKINLEKDPNFPKWLKKGEYQTDQTSGIAFLYADKDGLKHFLLADDIGAIHHMVMSDTSIVSISPVKFSGEVDKYLSVFPKKDFEEIVYDKYTNSVYISIEGNMPAPKGFTTILKLNFAGDNISSDSVVSVTKMKIEPSSLFTKYVQANVAYEGMAADEKYLYLGLEGFQMGAFFADSTVLFVVDKKSLSIIKEISTARLGIHTICGLYSDKNKSLYGIDRNNKKVFHLVLNDNLDVTESDTTAIFTGIPGYNSIPYVASLESITIDNNNNLYLVDDPWKTFFIPPGDVMAKLDTVTGSNFKKFVPVIFKYRLIK